MVVYTRTELLLVENSSSVFSARLLQLCRCMEVFHIPEMSTYLGRLGTYYL